VGKYRSRLQIMADVLAAVSDGARKTHIMYKANLSYKLLNRYLNEVLDAGLARLGDDGWYEITKKGRVFLERCCEYFERNQRLIDHINDVEYKREELESLLSS